MQCGFHLNADQPLGAEELTPVYGLTGSYRSPLALVEEEQVRSGILPTRCSVVSLF